MVRQKYSRATGVVIRDGKVLLVRERRQRDFGLAGGRIKAGETSATTVTREIYEETGLSAVRTAFVGTHEGRYVTHQVYLLDVTGEVRLERSEVDRAAWWDGSDGLPVQDHVKSIMQMCANAQQPVVVPPDLLPDLPR